MKNFYLTLIFIFVSLFSFSQCENDITNPYFVNFQSEPTVNCFEDFSNYIPQALDECDDSVEVFWYQEITPGYCSNSYDIFRVYRAFDDNGNQVVESQIIHVVDEIAPVFLYVPPSLTLNCYENYGFGTPIIDESCGGVTLTFEDFSDTELTCFRRFIRVWTATDDCGNTSTASQEIIYTDNQPPLINGVINLVVSENDNIDTSFVTVSDNCSIPSLVYNDVEVSGNNIIRTYLATDECGNTSTFEQIISINVIPPPDDEDEDEDEDDDEDDDEDEDEDDDEEDDDDCEDEHDDEDGNGNNRVAICHNLGNGNWITIYVAQPAVQAHLNHGDTLGPCDNNHQIQYLPEGMKLEITPDGKIKKYVKQK